MIKKVYIVLVLLISLIFNGCIVCPKFYSPTIEKKQKEISFKRDSLYINCGIPLGSDQHFTVGLWFDTRIKQDKIKNILITVLPDNRQDLSLVNVDMGCWQRNINPLNDSRYSKKSFTELPIEDRLTVINGSQVYYSFDFMDNKNITAKTIKLSYLIELNSGKKIERQENLMRLKSCHFAVH